MPGPQQLEAITRAANRVLARRRKGEVGEVAELAALGALLMVECVWLHHRKADTEVAALRKAAPKPVAVVNRPQSLEELLRDGKMYSAKEIAQALNLSRGERAAWALTNDMFKEGKLKAASIGVGAAYWSLAEIEHTDEDVPGFNESIEIMTAIVSGDAEGVASLALSVKHGVSQSFVWKVLRYYREHGVIPRPDVRWRLPEPD